MARNDVGDPGTWETARALGKQLTFPVGPYEPRVPTPDEMNAVIPYMMDRFSRFVTDKYFCENAEVTFAHILGISVPRYGFPDSSGYNNNSRNHNGYGRDWEGYDRHGYNREGFNREGFNYRGFDKDGYNRNGFDRDGFDRDGFNARGLDYNDRTREQGVATLVTGWSDDFAAAIAAHVAELNAAKVAEEAAQTAVAEAPVNPKKAPAKKAPAKKAPAKKAPAKKGALDGLMFAG